MESSVQLACPPRLLNNEQADDAQCTTRGNAFHTVKSESLRLGLGCTVRLISRVSAHLPMTVIASPGNSTICFCPIILLLPDIFLCRSEKGSNTLEIQQTKTVAVFTFGVPSCHCVYLIRVFCLVSTWIMVVTASLLAVRFGV